MSGGQNFYLAIQASCRHYDQSAVHLNARQSSSANGAKAFRMSCSGHFIVSDLVAPGPPHDRRR